jgi:hypothetical protein
MGSSPRTPKAKKQTCYTANTNTATSATPATPVTSATPAIPIPSNSVSTACGGSASRTRGVDERLAYVGRETEGDIDLARQVLATLPEEQGQRNNRLLGLAHVLMDAGYQDVQHCKGIVKAWLTVGVSMGVIGTTNFGDTWADFVRVWQRVDPSLREFGAAVIAARSAPPPVEAAEYENETMSRLAALCRELQRRRGADDFFLATRSAAVACGTSAMTISRYLAAFIADGLIVKTMDGNWLKREANCYRWLGSIPEPEELPYDGF